MPKVKLPAIVKLTPKKHRQKWSYWDAPETYRRPPKNNKDLGWCQGLHSFAVWDKDGGYHEYQQFRSGIYSQDLAWSAGAIKASLKTINSPARRRDVARVAEILGVRL